MSQVLREVVKNLVARRLDVAKQFLHQRIIIISELFEHRIARFLFARQFARWQVDDGRWRMFAIDERALEREIDEARCNAPLPDGNLPQ